MLQIEESVTSMVMRYGPRLWKLRVLQAELKMTIRPSPNSEMTNVRLCLANDSGYSLDIWLYREVTDPKTGVVSIIWKENSFSTTTITTTIILKAWFIRYQVLMALSVIITLLWGVMLCSLVERFLWNIGISLPNDVTSHSASQLSSLKTYVSMVTSCVTEVVYTPEKCCVLNGS